MQVLKGTIPKDLKDEILRLRNEGYTYNEINQTINKTISKSTLSYICSNILLSPEQKRRIHELNLESLKNARSKARIVHETIFQNRLTAISDKAAKVVKGCEHNVETAKLALATLYLGEGSKWASYRGLALGSANPDIILIYIKLLEICYGKSIDDFKLRVQYRADQNLSELEDYWSALTGISRTNFYKSTPDMRTKDKPTTNGSYKGVCVASCSGTDIQLELAAIAKYYQSYLGC